jgi:hypothetical protein
VRRPAEQEPQHAQFCRRVPCAVGCNERGDIILDIPT